jgi:hypothetical protein
MSKDPLEGQTVPTKKMAEKLSAMLGCSGAHRVGDFWGPCESRKDLDKLIELGNPEFREWKKRQNSTKSDPKTPAKPSERIRGSRTNKPGSASGSRGGIKLSASVEKSLKNKVKEHNEKMEKADKEDRKVTLGMLKAVWRRGAGAFSATHRPGMGRQQWSMGRVNAFLKLVSSGKPSNPKYTTDNDLLPKKHPRKTKKKSAEEFVESKAANDSFKPTSGMVASAKRGLEWRKEFNRGGTPVGVARARDIANGKNLSESTVLRMHSFFSRHAVDAQAEGWNSGEKGFPSAGRVAHELWGGNSGRSWSKSKRDKIMRERKEKAQPNSNEKTFSSEELASREAVRLGCFGAHRVRQGVWLPCANPEEYNAARAHVGVGGSNILRAARPTRRMVNRGKHWEELRGRGPEGIETLPGGGLVSGKRKKVGRFTKSI